MASLAKRIVDNPKHFILMVLTAPFIYGLIIPAVLADACTTLYQAICFPVYGIPKIKRRDYIVIDRHKLKHLNWAQKLNCVYCGYVNGVNAYCAEIAARTEWYWCPVKHGKNPPAPHAHYDRFIGYDDAADFPQKLRVMRQKCRACETGCDAAQKD